MRIGNRGSKNSGRGRGLRSGFAIIVALLVSACAAPTQAEPIVSDTTTSATVATGRAAAGTASAEVATTHASSTSPRENATTATKPAVTVTAYAGDGGVLTPGKDLTVSVALSNNGASSLSAGTVSVSLTDEHLTTRQALNSWMDPDSDDDAKTRQLAQSGTGSVAPGASTTIATVTVPAASVGITRQQTSVYGLKVSVSSNGRAVAATRTTLVWNPGNVASKVGLAVAMPITVPVNSAGLISSSDLATYTASDGLLTRDLNALRENSAITMAIDPMIIASIHVLGSSAPDSAQQWLEELERLPNESFPLQYGDADLAAQLQAGGIQVPLAPTSFGYALNPDDFASPLTVGETPEPTPTGTATAATNTPSPTPTPSENPNVPTTAQVLSWPYSLSGIAWPASASMRAADVATLAAAGFGTTILDSANTNAADLDTTPAAALPVSGGTALVSDDGVSLALRAAADATSDDARSAAMASLNAQLALISTEKGSANRVLLATLGRDWPPSGFRAGQTFSALDAMPWVQSVSLRTALQAPTTQGLAMVDKTEAPERIARVQQLRDTEAQLAAFASVLTDPTTLTGSARNGFLALLGIGWLGPQNDWPSAVDAAMKKNNAILRSVQILPTGTITVASAQSLIPITVTNDYTQPVNVVLRATASNGRIEVDSDTAKTIPAKASAKVLVPVKAKLGNGKVTLRLQLFSPPSASGTPQQAIGDAQSASVDVHADWEGLGALIIGILVVALFGFGLVRSILRRRRERHEADAAGPVDEESPVDDAEHQAATADDQSPDSTEDPRG
jgi:hypothetical protein